jgi:phytoene synthase
MSLRQPPQKSDWLACQQIAKTHGRSFYLASRMLGPERRRPILAAYAYCRLADDAVDHSGGRIDEGWSALHDWECQLEQPRHPVAIAFAEVRERYAIPDQPVRELFDGMRADLTISRYETWPELRRYCHLAAGTVGLIVAPILGCRDPQALPLAAELGIAMQLTNILRDVREDAEMGRIYLPLDELAAFGVDPEALLAGQPGEFFPDLLRLQIDRARGLYAHALSGVPSLSPGGRLTTLVAAELYAGILNQIEANRYDVFEQRAVVSRSKKVSKLAQASARFIRGSAIPANTEGTNAPNSRAFPSEADVRGRVG